MANKYISTRVLRPAYNAHAPQPASESASGVSGVSGTAQPNELYALREFFRVAKGEEKGTRTYAQRIARMERMYSAMENEASLSPETKGFAKDMVESYMPAARDAQRKRHSKPAATQTSLDTIVADSPAAPATATGYSAPPALEAVARDDALAAPAVYAAPKPSLWGRVRQAAASIAAAAVLYTSAIGLAPAYSAEAATQQAKPAAIEQVARLETPVQRIEISTKADPEKKSVSRRPSLGKIVFRVDDHDPATPDQVYVMQGGVLRTEAGAPVSVIRMREGDELITDLERSVLNPKPGEKIDIGYRYFGPDGVARTKDDTKFRPGSAIEITRAITLESLGFVPSDEGAGKGALFYMAEKGRKLNESVLIPVELLPPVYVPPPVTETPPPTPPPVAPPVVEAPPVVPDCPPCPPTEAVPPVVVEAPVPREALSYVRAVTGVASTSVHQERVGLAPIDPNYQMRGNASRVDFAHLTERSALTGTLERSDEKGSSKLLDHTFDWRHRKSAAGLDFKYSLFEGDGFLPFVMAGFEAESKDYYMNNKMPDREINFEPGTTTAFTPKVGVGVVSGPWNGSNAYVAATASRTSERNDFYENGWAWGNPHTADFALEWTSVGAEVGIQKMFSRGMVDAKATYRTNVTKPEEGFSDTRFDLGVAGVYDVAQFGGMTLGLVGRAALETLDRTQSDIIWNYSHKMLPTLQAGFQLSTGGKPRSPSIMRRDGAEPQWQASVDATVGAAQAEFGDVLPADVGAGTPKGLDYDLGMKLRTERAEVSAAGSFSKATESEGPRDVVVDKASGDVGVKFNLTSSTTAPFVLAGYSLDDSHLSMDTPDRLRRLGVTEQGWEAGLGLVHGAWTGSNVYASLSLRGMERESDSRNNLLDWGKPEIFRTDESWNEGVLRAGVRQFLGDLELDAEGFYRKALEGEEDGLGASVGLSYPVLERPTWSMDVLGRANWETSTQTTNPWLAMPGDDKSAGVGVRFSFGKKK